ncbi:hypothetical protein HELRODRAFT_184247, partial [Helobdella robusta]|uniref:Uncharacterized protein n=1 Tax=Helobdella robusta TaxID=6412 RepID=T1FKU6_HELRO
AGSSASSSMSRASISARLDAASGHSQADPVEHLVRKMFNFNIRIYDDKLHKTIRDEVPEETKQEAKRDSNSTQHPIIEAQNWCVEYVSEEKIFLGTDVLFFVGDRRPYFTFQVGLEIFLKTFNKLRYSKKSYKREML